MVFDPTAYGEAVARILALDGSGERLIPLTVEQCAPPAARTALNGSKAESLFKNAVAPAAAMAGLWLYFSCFEEAHRIAQDIPTAEGSFWHAILHRQEPDSGNAAYWFRRTGAHPVFPLLVKQTVEIVRRYPEAEFRPSVEWDPFGFILFCERARQQPASPSAMAALEIQRAEWQLLFDYCARSRS
jgi:hypothetical protein